MRVSAAGPVPADVAWQRYADLSQWPVWSPQIRSVDAPAGVLRPGLRGVVHPLVGPGVRFEVLDVDAAARTWTWRAHLPMLPLSLWLAHAVRATEAGGAATDLEIRGPAPVVLGYAPAAWWALRRLVTLPVS